MSKYQMAFKTILCCMSVKCNEQIGLIQELVDKGTPKTVVQTQTIYRQPKCTYIDNKWSCPKCKHSFDEPYRHTFKYCHECGQALDWSDITYGEI